MKEFSKSLRKPVGQRFREDGVIVIMIVFELFNEFGGPDTSGNGKASHIISQAGAFWCDKITQCFIGLSPPLFGLLAQHVEGCMHLLPIFIRIKLNIVTYGIGGIQSQYRSCL